MRFKHDVGRPIEWSYLFLFLASDDISCDFETDLCNWTSPSNRFVRFTDRSSVTISAVPESVSGDWYAICDELNPTGTCELSQDVSVDKDLMTIEFKFNIRAGYI